MSILSHYFSNQSYFFFFMLLLSSRARWASVVHVHINIIFHIFHYTFSSVHYVHIITLLLLPRHAHIIMLPLFFCCYYYAIVFHVLFAISIDADIVHTSIHTCFAAMSRAVRSCHIFAIIIIKRWAIRPLFHTLSICLTQETFVV